MSYNAWQRLNGLIGNAWQRLNADKEGFFMKSQNETLIVNVKKSTIHNIDIKKIVYVTINIKKEVIVYVNKRDI